MPVVVVNARWQQFDVYIGRERSYAGVAHRQAYLRDNPLGRIAQEEGQKGYFGNPIHFGQKCEICGQKHLDTLEGRVALLACFKRLFWRKINTDVDFFTNCGLLVDPDLSLRLGCFCDPQPCHGHVYRDWGLAGCPFDRKS